MDEQNTATGVLPSSSLDPTEINPHSLRLQTAAQHRVHANVWEERARNIDAFEKSGDLALARRAEKMGLCCVAPVLRIEHGRVPVVAPGRCRDRLCPLCSRVRGACARERIRKLVLQVDSLRMITLTIPRTDDGLPAVLDRLASAFQRLRRTETWKSHVTGGLFVVEITRGTLGDHWHVHLHVLASGSFFHFKTLSDAWALALGTPAITDIRAVHSRLKAAAYITKYVTKGTETREWSDDLVCELARGLHRRRLFGTFGSWHRVDVNQTTDEPDEKCPRHSVSMEAIVRAVREETLSALRHAPLIASLGFVAKRMLGDLCPPPDLEPIVTDAAAFRQLTLFGLTLCGEYSGPIDEQPPPAPPPPTPDTHTRPLFEYAYR